MNRLVAFGVSGWLALAAVGACQGPDSFDRAHPAGSSGGGGGKVVGVGGHGVGGNGVAGSGPGGRGVGGTGMGGTTGAGGTGTGGRGTGGRTGDAGTNCITAIQSGGYAAPSTPACSACKDNQLSLTDKCMGMIDCLAPLWPCTACFTNCLNNVGGSGAVDACVRALTAAACGP
jgi:hypothetical protein